MPYNFIYFGHKIFNYPVRAFHHRDVYVLQINMSAVLAAHTVLPWVERPGVGTYLLMSSPSVGAACLPH